VTATDAHLAISSLRIESPGSPASPDSGRRRSGRPGAGRPGCRARGVAEGAFRQPGAWLMATAKHRAIDSCAATSSSNRSTRSSAGAAGRRSRRCGSRCRPRRRGGRRSPPARLHRRRSVSTEARVALTLGCSAASPPEIARAFLVPRHDGSNCPAKGPGRGESAFEVPAAPVRDAAGFGARGHLPHLQRRLPATAGTTGCGRRSAKTPSGSAASSPSWPRKSRKCMGWSH
jgi:hypothetical protein